MGVFAWLGKGRRKDAPPEEWWQSLARLEGEMEQLQLAWEETYGKVRRALANIARRQKVELEEENGAPAPQRTAAGPRDPHVIGEKLRAARARYNRS